MLHHRALLNRDRSLPTEQKLQTRDARNDPRWEFLVAEISRSTAEWTRRMGGTNFLSAVESVADDVRFKRPWIQD